MSAPSFDPRTAAGPSLESALDRLVARGTLGRDQADAVLAELAEAALGTAPWPDPGSAAGTPGTSGAPGQVPAGAAGDRTGRAWTAVLAEVGGYVGAAFVVAAVAVFTGPRWEQLSHAAQLAVWTVPAVLSLVAAVLLAQAAPGRWTALPSPDRGLPEGLGSPAGLGPRRRLVAALLATGGALLAGTVATALPDGFGDGYGEATATLAFLTACAVWALGYAFCRIALLHVGVAAAAAGALSAGLPWLIQGDSTAWNGAALALLAVLWAGLVALRVLAERQLGYGVAGVIGFIGGELLATGSTGGGWGYLVLLVLAVAGLAGYVGTRMITMLVVGVVALGTVVPQAIIDYTDGALGAAGALLVTGLSIVGASVLGLRLHREVPGRH